MKKFYGLIEKAQTWIVSKRVKVSSYSAKMRLKTNGPIKVLIDTNVLRYGRTHTSTWINTDDEIPYADGMVATGYLARIPVEYNEKHKNIFELEAPYFAQLAYLSELNLIHFFSSLELDLERLRQSGKSNEYFGLNLWSDIEIRDTKSPVDFLNYGFLLNKHTNSAQEQSKRIRDNSKNDLLEIFKLTEYKHTLDIFHVYTAKFNEIDYFITCDRKFINYFESLPTKTRKKFGSVKVLKPSDLGKHLGIIPISIRHLTPLNVNSPFEMR